MGGLRGQEILIIVILLILVFGWKKLPDAARSLGRSARVFKSEVEEMKKDGKDGAGEATVPGQSSGDPQRPQQQVAPPPVEGYQQQQQYQQPHSVEQPQAHPQHQSFEQPQAQPQYEQPQQPYRNPGETPDDPTRPVA